MNVTRTPLYFGPDARALFGWYHAPADGRQRELAIVICPPLGHEYVNSHRSERHLADALARAGIPALRFDYDGTGDSAGDDEDPARVAAWSASIGTAMTTLRALAHAPRIGLLGIRLGATLAAAVAAERDDVDCLVQWAPVRGRAYARELKALHLTGINRDAVSTDGSIEPGGFVVTEETQRDLGALSPGAPRTTRVLTLGERFDEMFLPPHSAVVPHDAIARTVDQLIAWSGDAMQCAQPIGALRETATFGDARESFVRFDGIFGIASEPSSRKSDAPAILLVNAGSTHHVGPNRLYVHVARALAQAGFRTLRFDLPGLGDSVIDDVARENDPYLPESSDVLADVVARLHAPRVVLAGVCSGAHASFHAAAGLASAPIVESIVINPLTFDYQRGMSLDQPTTSYSEWQRYLRSMRTLAGWKRLFRRETPLSTIVRTVIDRARLLAKPKKGDPTIERNLRAIVGAGRQLTFVFSQFDPGYELLMLGAGPTVRALRKEGRIALWRIANATHTFESKATREVMIASLREHLTRRYAST
ncbi:MAG: alpha/beta fold hydrolase [Acidobacteria bacterium]|nr:alpha/beta fold hydrolase [Acidobacteriota bacterium]MBV9478747.1 alpha/beta fold hydrolase [Acidobacteriota bacterium]